MKRKKPLLGLCPIGKFVFSHEDALKYKAIIENKLKLWNVDFVGVDDAIADGMVRSQNDVRPVVEYLKQKNIDALFIPHCNFGTEGAAAVIARDLNVPTLLWGPRDEAPMPDGRRLRDTLCGMFATSKVLRKLGVRFTYIENCSPDDDIFRDGVDNFTRAANVVRKMKGMRIGQIGGRIDFFWTTIINESELLERYGIEILPIDMVDFIKDVEELAGRDRDRYIEEIEKTDGKKQLSFDDFDSIDQIINIYAVRDAMLAIAEKYGLDAISVQSFMSICDALGCMIEYSCAMVTDTGVPAACESDIHGAISSVMLQAASFDTEPVFLADLTVRHPQNDNAVLIWHCNFPESLKHPDKPASIGSHWILPGQAPGSCHWEMKEGPITILRFDGDRGEYGAICGQGHSVEGPPTLNTYVWMEVTDWPAWERAFMMGPYIHHVAGCYGNYASVMKEASKYIQGLHYEQLP